MPISIRRVMADGASFVYLADVYVLDEHRGRGLGIELIKEIVERGPFAGRRWVLHTRDMHSLYEKFGFRPVGLRPRYYSDNGEDALIMTTLPLADPAMRERIARLRAAVDAASAPSRPGAEDA